MRKRSDEHGFITRPHRTIIGLSIPVTLSLIAEPITGLVDTAFIARLGTQPLAALGIGTTALTSTFWIFNFLSISAQTEVAKAFGASDQQRAVKIGSLAMLLGACFGIIVFALFMPAAPWLTQLLGADGGVQTDATLYLRIRLFGAPAVLITMVGFGILRGLQDMRTPLWIAALVNIINIILDAPFIFGLGPLPGLGVAGSATASTISQWIGALVIVRSIHMRLGFAWHIHTSDVTNLLRVGGDLFVRTGLLTVFLFLTTRVANQISDEAGAAHQAIRTVWLLTGLLLDGFAVTAQSLVGYFIGADNAITARRAAAVSSTWALGIGFALAAAMLLSTGVVIGLLVPPAAVMIFIPAWIVASITQPLNALAFVTDGIHWGTGDYAFLRNAMLLATAIASGLILTIDSAGANAFLWLWAATGIWIGLRMIFGMTRIWPGYGVHALRMSQPANSIS